ncbi:MAG: CotH kinase family protein [Bacteroidales bacterium]|nr:CotH kinase family protein [Bacteroidales bacterium]
MKHVLTFLIIFSGLFLHEAKAQRRLSDTAFTYFRGIEEPPSNWNENGFDDSGWSEGSYSIGFGDSDDHTVIEPASSVYTRHYFNIDETDSIEEMILLIDFDDGFVAYLNGVEFARVNMGKIGSPTCFDQLADRSHEAYKYRNLQYVVPGYYIDNELISGNLVYGENVIAIEVHNDSIDGSDLSMEHGIYDITDAYYNIFSVFSRYKRCMELDSTELPVIKIESDEFGIPHKRIEVPAYIEIIDKGSNGYNKPYKTEPVHAGPVKIELRGESSSTFPKQSFDFELKQENSADTSISLLGMPEEEDWILQGPFADKSQIRNAFIYDLGNRTQYWNPHVRFCEVIINGEYVGLYNLIEKIKRDDERLDLANLRPEEISGIDLTGGYIVKYDKGPGGLQIVYPKESDLQPEQEEYIRGHFDEYYSVLGSEMGLDHFVGYPRYIDVNSLIELIIISELSKNCDAYMYSSYMYKDRNDRDSRIVFGPLWDFDLCFGNSQWQEGFQTEEWQFDYRTNNKFKITRLFQDPSLVEAFANRWFELREQYLHTDSLISKLDMMVSTYQEAIDRNYEVWPVIDEGLFFPAYEVYTYEEEINYIKNWLLARLDWIDNNIYNIYYPVTSTDDVIISEGGTLNQINVFPNPFQNELNLKLNLEIAGNVDVNIVHMNGAQFSLLQNAYLDPGEYFLQLNISSDLPEGMYLLRILQNGKPVGSIKVLKVN